MQNKLNIEGLKEDINLVFSDYSFELEYREVESNFEDDQKAWKVKITPKYEPTEFEIHVEEIDGCYQFEYGEDIWEHLDEDHLFRYMFFEALSEIRMIKKSLSKTQSKS